MPILTDSQTETAKRRHRWPKVVLLMTMGSPFALALMLIVAPLSAGDNGLRVGPFWIFSGLLPYSTSTPVTWETAAGSDTQYALLTVNLGRSAFGWIGCYDPKRRLDELRR